MSPTANIANFFGISKIFQCGASEKANHWMLIDKKFENNNSTTERNDIENFIHGSNCTWPLIFSGNTVSRDCSTQIVEKIHTEKCIGVLGAGGEGKSTILKQVAKILLKKGWTVYFDNSPDDISIPDNNKEKTVYIIDNAHYCESFHKIINCIADKSYKIIFSSRTNEWNTYTATYGLTARNYNIVEVDRISTTEAGKFAQYILKISHIDSEEKIKGIFENKSNGFLYAAMLEAVHGKSLQEIAADIINRIRIMPDGTDILHILGCICMIEYLGGKFPKLLYNILLNVRKIKKNRIDNALSKELQYTKDIIETRHPLISKLFAQNLEIALSDPHTEIEEEIILSILESCIKLKTSIISDIKKDIYYNQISSIVIQYLFDNNFLTDFILQRIIEENADETLLLKCTKYARKEQKRILFSKICEWRSNFESIWAAWGRFEIEQNNIGDVTQENCARWILKTALMETFRPNEVWSVWAQLEIDQGNLGHVEQENSARWILKSALEKSPDVASIIAFWSNMEAKQGDKAEARRFFKDAIKKLHNKSKIWIDWALFEIRQNNLGTVEQVNSARWVLKSALEKSPDDTSIVEFWANLEAEQGDIAEARRLFKKATKRRQYKSKIWIDWAFFEIRQNNLGTVEQENSARWVLKSALEKSPDDTSLVVFWANQEEEQGNIAEARQLFKNAIKRHHYKSKIWIDWALFEIRQNNLGTVAQEHSARCILKSGLEKSPGDPSIVAFWANLEAEHGDIAEARRLFKDAIIKRRHYKSKIWIDWALFEIRQNNLGTAEQENSARWIFHNCAKRETLTSVLHQWVCAEIDAGFVQNAVDLLIESLKNSYNGLALLCIIQARQRNFNPLDPYSVENLAPLMLAKLSDKKRTLFNLYLCYKHFGDKTIAQKYYENLGHWNDELAEIQHDVLNVWNKFNNFEELSS